jgi:hypothetical protein
MKQESIPAPDEAVDVTWTKALSSLRASRQTSIDPESAFALAHQSALQGALAVLRASGCHVAGRDQHHHPFSRVTALDAGELSRAARAVGRFRRVMGEVLYGPVRIDAAQLAEMHSAAGRLLVAAHAWLREARPGLTLTSPGG